MGNTHRRNTYQFSRLQTVTNSTEFYQWCRGYFKGTLLQANLYSVLDGIFGYYVVATLKHPPAFLHGQPIDVCIDLKSNDPSLDKRKWSLKRDDLNALDLTIRRLPYYDLEIKVSIIFSPRRRSQFRIFRQRFESSVAFARFLTCPKPIEWGDDEPS